MTPMHYKGFKELKRYFLKVLKTCIQGRFVVGYLMLSAGIKRYDNRITPVTVIVTVPVILHYD